MKEDLTVPVGKEGMVNIRVGAIIRKGDCLLLAKDKRDGAYYTIGGRVQMGESAEEAIQREVMEELGMVIPVKTLAYIHENFFFGDYEKLGYKKLVYEICWYFLMDSPEDLEERLLKTSGEMTKNLRWIPLSTEETYYPTFFREELDKPFMGLKHLVSDERLK